VSRWIVAGDPRIALQKGDNLIGRDPAAAIVLDGAGVSRRHARVVVDEEGALLEDLGRTLERLHVRQGRVVELRFFAGLSLEETAHVLNVSVGTVRRDWSLAQAWLFRELSRSPAR
jgi:DNA-directed RNA polymerase specialized sigma24 family protein